MIAFSKLPEPGETIVKLRKGKGEPPLIVFHGQFPLSALVDSSLKSLQEARLAFDFRSCPEKFPTAVWTVQVTPDGSTAIYDEYGAEAFGPDW